MYNVICQAQAQAPAPAQSVELTFLRKQKYLDTFNINSYGWCWGVTELILGAAANSRIEIYVKLENSLNTVPNWCTSLQFSLVFCVWRHSLINRIAGGFSSCRPYLNHMHYFGNLKPVFLKNQNCQHISFCSTDQSEFKLPNGENVLRIRAHFCNVN